jgi:thiamine kinase-like enzyme
LEAISKVFNVPEREIKNITPIKLGMTNHSFLFEYDDFKYIMRIPGEGTDKLIDREKEHAVYKIVAPLGLCDDIIYFDSAEGYKISGYMENARVCDPLNKADVKACMDKLRELHERKLNVEYTFDLFERIEYFESLWLDPVSCFRDYEETKANVLCLREYIDSIPKQWTLTHIDAVPDNFLFIRPVGEEEQMRQDNGAVPLTCHLEARESSPCIVLIDWEYSAMQDPHVDIAMFAVYSMHDREEVESLIDYYFEAGGCTEDVRSKIYAYIAACGLLWSNWCEYKSQLGVEFGEYALRQYRFAKDYYKIFCETRTDKCVC